MADRGPEPVGGRDEPGFFDVAYEGTPTWDIGRPQPAVLRLAQAGAFRGSILDVGCGTGEHALLLASRGHEVLGIDAAPAAIRRAHEKAAERAIRASFRVWDALRLPDLGLRADTVLDVGLFHTFAEEERAVYASSLEAVLSPGGRLLLLCWSERNEWGFGPRRVSRAEIRSSFSEGWTVDAIEPETLESRLEVGPIHAWQARVDRA